MNFGRVCSVGVVIGAGLCASPGCSSADFGESVSLSRQRRSQLQADTASAQPLIVPRDEAFNVTSAQRFSTGEGRSESYATEGGTAGCSAAVDGQGEAWAEFQLGHVLLNDQTDPVDVIVSFDCEFQYSVVGDLAAPQAADMVALKLYIQDSDRAMVQKETLVSRDDALGAHQRSGRESPSFNLTMQPGLAYLLVLAGRVETNAEADDAPAEARVEVTQLRIEVAAR